MTELANKYLVAYLKDSNGWSVFKDLSSPLCSTGHSVEDRDRAQRIADTINLIGDNFDLPRQAEIAITAIGRTYDMANRMIGKYQDDESVLDDIERFREISGAALYQIYHAPHLKPGTDQGD